MAKAKDTRTESEKAYHENEVSKMYLAGMRQVDIAAKLGIDQSTVSRHLTTLRARWQREANKNIKTAQGEKLKELEWVREEAKAAWSVSKTITVKSSGDDGHNFTQTTTSAGDPRFLDQLLKAIAQEMKLLGLDDTGMKLPKETLLLIEALGLDIKEVVKTLTGMLRKAVQGDTDDLA